MGESPRKKQKTMTDYLSKTVTRQSLSDFQVPSDQEQKWETIKRDNLHLTHRVVFDRSRCKDIFAKLEEEVEYLTGDLARVKVFGKWHSLPRQQAAYGDPGLTYSYSGVTVPARQWTPTLDAVREVVNGETGQVYNFVLVNRYKDGGDRMGEHKDDEKELDENVPIASLTFGAERDFVLRHEDKTRGVEKVKMVLKDGMLLLMKYPTNRFWYHGLPARKSCSTPRINLTFRKIVKERQRSRKKLQ